jgi:hypothetical protein
MRKGFIFAGLLFTLTLSYLFYRSCKRDTIVTGPMDRIQIPDSSWLYGSINLKQIKKDITWSVLLNGDFNKIFQTDTSTNTLIKILRSPDTYSITQQDSIRYFSVWKDSINYNAMLFTLEDPAALKKSFKSDSFNLNQKNVYSFRTKEGIWLYDVNNLLFVSGTSDSLAARSFFAVQNTSTISVASHIEDTLYFTSDQISLISGHINTSFIPAAIKPALLDSAFLSFQVMSNDEMLDLKFTYNGFLSTALNQSSITHQNNEAALFCAANLNVAGIERLLSKIPSVQQLYLKQKAKIAPLLSALNTNNLTLEFNGWKKIKSSYYTSVMNDEFETVLQKRDSSIIEPVFKISLEQKSKTAALNFLNYLQKEGLVAKGTQQPFAIIYGNFDSELNLDANNTFVIRNKHTTGWPSTPGPEPLDAALLLQIHPALIKGLSDANIEKHSLFEKFKNHKQIETAMLHVQKQQNQLTATVKITFNDKNHPFISLMKLLKSN